MNDGCMWRVADIVPALTGKLTVEPPPPGRPVGGEK